MHSFGTDQILVGIKKCLFYVCLVGTVLTGVCQNLLRLLDIIVIKSLTLKKIRTEISNLSARVEKLNYLGSE